jgi:hypothetical protein
MGQMTKEYQISPMTMHRLCRDDLGTYPYKLQKCQLLSGATKQKRLDRSKKLLKRHRNGTHQNLIFSDEKLFTVEAAFNHQNDRVFSKSVQAIPKDLKKNQENTKACILDSMGCCVF